MSKVHAYFVYLYLSHLLVNFIFEDISYFCPKTLSVFSFGVNKSQLMIITDPEFSVLNCQTTRLLKHLILLDTSSIDTSRPQTLTVRQLDQRGPYTVCGKWRAAVKLIIACEFLGQVNGENLCSLNISSFGVHYENFKQFVPCKLY